MNMRKVVKTAFLVLLYQFSFAQNEMDVLRYSTTDVFGSARFEAMAGSFGGLGADISAMQINPAGMGRFSSSRVAVSFNNSVMSNQTTYNGRESASSHNKFTLSSAGVVFTTDLSEKNIGRRYSQVTLGYTRLKNFSNSIRYEGQNFYSLLDVFANDGRGIDPEYIYDERPFTTGLAYDVFALDYDMNGNYISRLTMGDMYHDREINTGGGIGEFHIGYSENYGNVFYYGGSIGIRRVKYDENYTHSERLLDTVGTTLRSFDYRYEQYSTGTGLNLKLGVLFLPSEQIRLGLAFESPTVVGMKEEWSANMTAMHNDGLKSVLPEYVPVGRFDYRVKTPMKLRASFAYILGLRGAINVDLEMARLPGGMLRPSNDLQSSASAYTFEYENNEVEAQFRTILNTRIGMEYMIFPDFFLRGGIAILPQPYKKEIGNINTPNMTYSGGIGWESKRFAVDLSYRVLSLSSDYYAFDPSKIENRAEFNTNVHNIVITAGFKF